MRRTDPAWSWNDPAIPDSHPFYTRLLTGLDGRIWLSLFGDPIPATPGTVVMMPAGRVVVDRPPPASRAPTVPALASTPMPWDVFEPSGAYIGRVEIPPRVVLAAMSGDQVWGVAYNQDDVAFVKRYRIRWR